MLPAFDCEARAFEEDAIADPQVQSVGFDHGTAASRGLQELEAESLAPPGQQVYLALRFRALLLEALDLRQLHLCLARHLLRRCAKAGDEALEALDVAPDPVGALRSCVQTRRLLDSPFVPRAGEVRRASGLELEHGVRDRFEEPAVVGHDHHAGVEGLQLPLEPLEALDVEMVGRLVEEQEVRIAAQRSAE